MEEKSVGLGMEASDRELSTQTPIAPSDAALSTTTPISRVFFDAAAIEPRASSMVVMRGLDVIPEKITSPGVTLIRDAYFVEAVRALGRLFFSCPPVIETVVETWMGRKFMSRKEDPIEMLKYVLSIVSTQRPALQMRIRRVTDFMSKPLARVCAVSFFCDTHNTGAKYDFECDDALLPAPIYNFNKSEPLDKVKARLALIVSSIVSYNKRGGFMQCDDPIGVQTCDLSCFESNDLLHECYDPSVYIIATLRHVLLHCEALEESKQDATRLESDAAEEEARYESIHDIMTACDTFIREMRHRIPCLASPKLQLDDDLLVYDSPYSPNKPDSDSKLSKDDFIYGVPIDVICDAPSTLLWLQSMWCAEGVSNLRRLVCDLWRAKQIVLAQEYYDFFQDWDEEQLNPVLARIAQQLPDISTTNQHHRAPTQYPIRSAPSVIPKATHITTAPSNATPPSQTENSNMRTPGQVSATPPITPESSARVTTTTAPAQPMSREEAMYLSMRELMTQPNQNKNLPFTKPATKSAPELNKKPTKDNPDAMDIEKV